MNNLWKWYVAEKPFDNLDPFLTGLKNASNQKGLLHSFEEPQSGDIQTSCQMLLLAPSSCIDKVVDIAIEMDKFMKNNYSSPSENLKLEMLAIPAMLESIEPKLKKLNTDSATRAINLIKKERIALCQPGVPASNRDVYDRYLQVCKTTIKPAQKLNLVQSLKAKNSIEI